VPDINVKTLATRLTAAALPAFWGVVYPPFKIIRFKEF